tara:strand:+ start:670 stop:873 length:204 start_codon:yes stop_codon:yes gene_type:complete
MDINLLVSTMMHYRQYRFKKDVANFIGISRPLLSYYIKTNYIKEEFRKKIVKEIMNLSKKEQNNGTK